MYLHLMVFYFQEGKRNVNENEVQTIKQISTIYGDGTKGVFSSGSLFSKGEI